MIEEAMAVLCHERAQNYSDGDIAGRPLDLMNNITVIGGDDQHAARVHCLCRDDHSVRCPP